MTGPGTCLASQVTLSTGNSYELCPFATARAAGRALPARMTSGMPHGLESRRGTQLATPTPSNRARAVLCGGTYHAGTRVRGARVG